MNSYCDAVVRIPALKEQLCNYVAPCFHDLHTYSFMPCSIDLTMSSPPLRQVALCETLG